MFVTKNLSILMKKVNVLLGLNSYEALFSWCLPDLDRMNHWIKRYNNKSSLKFYI